MNNLSLQLLVILMFVNIVQLNFHFKINIFLFQYYSAQGISTRHLDPTVCAVCGNRLLVSENEEGVIENTYKLTCEHV